MVALFVSPKNVVDAVLKIAKVPTGHSFNVVADTEMVTLENNATTASISWELYNEADKWFLYTMLLDENGEQLNDCCSEVKNPEEAIKIIASAFDPN